MAATAVLRLPARASRGAGAGRSAEQEGVVGWLTRVLGLLLAHTGAWFAMENRRKASASLLLGEETATREGEKS